MHLRKELEFVAEAPRPLSFGDFRRHIDPDWIQEALQATGTASLRKRRLPAEQVIWAVLGMALMRDRSIVDVVDSLDLALPGSRGPTVAPSTVPKARARLGEEPLAWLFVTCAEHWAHPSADLHRWRGLAVYGVDGTSLRVPDSTENREHFGSQSNARGKSAYPLLRLVALFALRSHLIAAAVFGPYSKAETAYARELWSELPDQSLCIVDRLYFAADVLIPLSREGTSRHWLTRAKKNHSWQELEKLGKDDFLVEMKVSASARKKDPSLPERWKLRAIRYKRTGFQPQWLLTSLMDAKNYPAPQVAAMYHERWEIELGYDEIKTEMLDREEAIRSQGRVAVRQEVWGILLAYNLVRLEMERVAEEAGVPPTRISFIAALHLICDEWVWCASAAPGAIPRHLRNLRANLRRYILPPRRSQRRYPRTVKIKMTKFPRNRRSIPPEGSAK